MATDYVNATAGLLEGDTRASTAKLDRQAQRGMQSEALLQKSADTAQTEMGANKRQEVSGKQAQLLATIRDQADNALEVMKQKEESKRQQKALEEDLLQHHQANYFTMTPNTVKGIKDTMDLDFSKLEGQEVNKDLILGMMSAKYKTDIADLMARSKPDKTATDLQKELDKIEGSIKSGRDKLFSMSTKDLPSEVWQGGKPGDFRALVQNVSKGKLGNLSPEAQSQVNIVAGYINTMKSQQERANKIHSQLGSSTVDYTGLGIGDEDKAVKKYNTAADVQVAFKAGQIDRNTAKQILADQFGMK